MVERQLPKLNVAGSNPVSRSKEIAHVAQQAERHLGKVEVVGSSPIVSSKLCKTQNARLSLLMKRNNKEEL